jgi:hypothetical protein
MPERIGLKTPIFFKVLASRSITPSAAMLFPARGPEDEIYRELVTVPIYSPERPPRRVRSPRNWLRFGLDGTKIA